MVFGLFSIGCIPKVTKAKPGKRIQVVLPSRPSAPTGSPSLAPLPELVKGGRQACRAAPKHTALGGSRDAANLRSTDWAPKTSVPREGTSEVQFGSGVPERFQEGSIGFQEGSTDSSTQPQALTGFHKGHEGSRGLRGPGFHNGSRRTSSLAGSLQETRTADLTDQPSSRSNQARSTNMCVIRTLPQEISNPAKSKELELAKAKCEIPANAVTTTIASPSLFKRDAKTPTTPGSVLKKARVVIMSGNIGKNRHCTWGKQIRMRAGACLRAGSDR